jgi:hypothetical protein
LERAPDTKGLVISKKVSFESEIFFTAMINLKQVYLSRAGRLPTLFRLKTPAIKKAGKGH